MPSSSWKRGLAKQRAVGYLLGEAGRKGLSEASSGISHGLQRLTRSSVQGEHSSRREEEDRMHSMWLNHGQQVDRGRRVPRLLAVVRRAISDNDLWASEGLFRVSADARVQALVRERLEQGEEPERVLDGCSAEVLSGVLKEHLRLLPGGTWPTGDAAAELQVRLLKGGSGHSIILLKQALLPAQLQIFLWVLDLLVTASAHSATSRMDDRALAVIFAPLLIPVADDAPAAEQLRMAHDGVKLLQKMIADHRKTCARRATPPMRHAGIDVTDAPPATSATAPQAHAPRGPHHTPPALGGVSRGATKRGSNSELAAPLPVRRKSSLVDATSTSGLTTYTQSALTFDEALNEA